MNLYNRDESLLLPIISAWIELSATTNSNAQLHDLVLNALHSHDESDIPFLIRTLIKSYDVTGPPDLLYEALLEVLFCNYLEINRNKRVDDEKLVFKYNFEIYVYYTLI